MIDRNDPDSQKFLCDRSFFLNAVVGSIGKPETFLQNQLSLHLSMMWIYSDSLHKWFGWPVGEIRIVELRSKLQKIM